MNESRKRPEDWTFFNAPLAPDRAEGRADADGSLSIRLPSRRACAWWEREIAVASRGVRFRAEVRVALGPDETALYNDLAMLVTWYDPARGARKGVPFLRRDFVRCADDGAERVFDDVLEVPDGCRVARVEIVAKWHRMDVEVRGFAAEPAEAPPPRVVRCVVANPHERKSVDWRDEGTAAAAAGWDDPAAVVAERLGRMEACLDRIAAELPHPDIVLFSELFADTGTPCPEKTAERVPGGPSFALASRWAEAHRCHVAMNVRERTDAGTFHNTTFVADRAGRLAGVYRKATLTSGEYMSGILPGDDFGVLDLDFGRVGCLTCWDNWFSETAKFLRRKGAELLLFPLAGGAADHMEMVFPVRSVDTGIPTLLATRQGHLPSGVIGRDGAWLAKTLEDGGYAWADVDLAARVRTHWLSVGPGDGDPYQLYLDESRPELYERQDLRRPRR
ncbi:MAG: carbon-nitrogen hydrolase family protein [Kiritimatiellae bacterium]|nr:carbon-nitrogen hydrolase family protein [Kiritimatiellia bacterium]